MNDLYECIHQAIDGIILLMILPLCMNDLLRMYSSSYLVASISILLTFGIEDVFFFEISKNAHIHNFANAN
jgi:hypothetical protein